MKQKSYFLLLVVLFIFTSCGGYHSRQYSGPILDKSKVSIITTDNQFTTIAGVDGEKVDLYTASNISNVLIWGRFPRTISVLPGKHSIWPCFQNPYENVCAEGWIDIETKAGHSYVIKHERSVQNKKMIKFWVENQDSTEKTQHQKLLGL